MEMLVQEGEERDRSIAVNAASVTSPEEPVVFWRSLSYLVTHLFVFLLLPSPLHFPLSLISASLE